MEVEPARRPGKPRAKNPAKKPRKKEKEYDWRADTATQAAKPASAPVEVADDGFKGLKKKWLHRYIEQTQAKQRGDDDSAGPAPAAAAAAPAAGVAPAQDRPKPVPEAAPAASPAAAPAAAPQDDPSRAPALLGSPPMPAGREPAQPSEQERPADGPGRRPNGEPAAPAAEARVPAEGAQPKEERRRQSDDHRGRRDGQDAGEPVPAKPRKAFKREGSGASGFKRGAQAGGERGREARPAKQPRLQHNGAQLSHRSSEHAADTGADVQQQLPALSGSNGHPRSPPRRGGEAGAQRSGRVASPPGQPRGVKRRERPPHEPAASQAQQRAPASQHTPEELVAETKGAAAAEAGEAGRPEGSCAPAAPLPLMQVTFLEGDEKEQLGELDLNQLTSFRELWLTIRSAYSARLPKGELRLTYCDVDGDLMLCSDEPWEHFRLVARSLFLARKQRS